MKKLVVLLDNGHGKNTKGKCSPDKRLMEWQWTRDITSRIYNALFEAGIEVFLLVPEDGDTSLTERVRREKRLTEEARVAGKETCLISVHVDAAGCGCWGTARGWTCWVAKTASQKSKQLAQLLYSECEKRGLKGNRCVPACRYWQKDYMIVKSTGCPAVLTENLFQDNKADVDYLLSEEGRQAITDLHVEAIKKYMEI